MNLVHHSYWNLAGHDRATFSISCCKVNAEFYTPVDDELIPTGEILAVAGTAFDFREEKAIGREGGRYDHNWIISDFGPGLRPVAALHDPKSGRTMELRSSEPGVQIYTAGYIDPPVVGKGGQLYRRYSGSPSKPRNSPIHRISRIFLMPGCSPAKSMNIAWRSASSSDDLSSRRMVRRKPQAAQDCSS